MPTSTCKFGSVRDSPLIDSMGCGMSDPTQLEWLLRERFQPREMNLNSKDSKPVWGKSPNSANHGFRTYTVKQKVEDKIIIWSRMTKRTDVPFMSKQYEGRKCWDKGQPWEGRNHGSLDKASRICPGSEWKACWGIDGWCQCMMKCLLLCDEMDG